VRITVTELEQPDEHHNKYIIEYGDRQTRVRTVQQAGLSLLYWIREHRGEDEPIVKYVLKRTQNGLGVDSERELK
jgi:hypothetical protein